MAENFRLSVDGVRIDIARDTGQIDISSPVRIDLGGGLSLTLARDVGQIDIA